jgi:hypothetical protein
MALVRTDASEEFTASIIRLTRIGELVTLIIEAIRFSETSVALFVGNKHDWQL